jgi:hypothetical protein
LKTSYISNSGFNPKGIVQQNIASAHDHDAASTADHLHFSSLAVVLHCHLHSLVSWLSDEACKADLSLLISQHFGISRTKSCNRLELASDGLHNVGTLQGVVLVIITLGLLETTAAIIWVSETEHCTQPFHYLTITRSFSCGRTLINPRSPADWSWPGAKKSTWGLSFAGISCRHRFIWSDGLPQVQIGRTSRSKMAMSHGGGHTSECTDCSESRASSPSCVARTMLRRESL